MQNGHVKDTDSWPKSLRGTKNCEAAGEGVNAEPVATDDVGSEVAAANSVTVTCLPSVYVVTVFFTAPLGTAAPGGGRGGSNEVMGNAVTVGISSPSEPICLSLNRGADGAASLSREVRVINSESFFLS